MTSRYRLHPQPTMHLLHAQTVEPYSPSSTFQQAILGVMCAPNLIAYQRTVTLKRRAHITHRLTSRIGQSAQPVSNRWRACQMAIHLLDQKTDSSLVSNPRISKRLVSEGWVGKLANLCVGLFQAAKVDPQRAEICWVNSNTAGNYSHCPIGEGAHPEGLEHVVVLAPKTINFFFPVLLLTYPNSSQDRPNGPYSLNPGRCIAATPWPTEHPPTKDNNCRGNNQSPYQSMRANSDYHFSRKHSHLLAIQEDQSLPAQTERVHGGLAA